jgi:hypothetical protein
MTEKAENLLKQCLRELVERMLPHGDQAPKWNDVLFIEDARIDWKTRTASEKALGTLEAFAPAFAALLARSPSWIKFSAEGVWRHDLVVIVSASETTSTQIPTEQNVLCSGVANAVAEDSGWGIERSFKIVSS